MFTNALKCKTWQLGRHFLKSKRKIKSFILFFSLARIHKFGCFTRANPIFGRTVSKEKYSSHSCGGRLNYVIVVAFRLICQAFQPNFSQVSR